MRAYAFDHSLFFAQAYGTGTFGSCDYNSTTCTPSNSTSGSSLANTGLAVAGIVTVACVVLLVAVAVRVWKRPKKAEQEQEAADESEQTPRQ